MEAVRILKTNLKLENKPCGWCQVALKLGEDAAMCTACEAAHHGRCWEGKAGCSTAGCVSAPLPRLDAAAAPAAAGFGSPFPGARAAAPAQDLPPGYFACFACRVPMLAGTQVCPACKTIVSPDGLYHGPKLNAPGAVQSLVLGLVGLVFCNIILGPIAISKASSAKRAMASDPTLGGEGYATAGTVLGVIDIVVFVIYLMLRASAA